MFARSALIAFFLLVMLGAGALAAEDPPGRVGRLSYLEGDVMFRAAEQDAWAPATQNFPITTGHSIWTESGGLAEIQVGPAELRLREQTELDVLSLDDRGQVLALRQGTLALRLRTAAPDLRIDTPRGVISFPKPGRYRIDVADDGITATVFEGEANLEEMQGAHIVRAGESARIFGEPRQIDFARAQMTSFDSWTLARDQATAAPETLTRVSPQMTGYQDLERHGTWARAPEYGTVWYPTRVVDDWAPYRYGHWAYVEPWGWTWIDDAPWGFAPFHYGRWVRVGHRWAWWPGAYIERPVYAPALVAFIGGSGWSVSVFSSNVGWVPLAPYEIYRPHYRTSVTYVRNVNITVVNKTVIKTISVRHHDHDRDVHRFKNHGAATVVGSDAFKHSRRVHEARVEVPRERIAAARTSDEPRHIKPAVAMREDKRDRGPRRERNTVRRDEPRAMAAPQSQPKAEAAPAPQRRADSNAERPRRMDRESADSVKREPRGERPAPQGHERIERAPEPRAAHPEREPERERAVPRTRAPDPAPQPRAMPQPQREAKPVPAYRQPPRAEPQVARPDPERERTIPRYRAPDPPPQPRAMPQPQREAAPAAPAYRQQAAREERRVREDRPQRGADEDRRRERKERAG